jgi:hypothetical protein
LIRYLGQRAATYLATLEQNNNPTTREQNRVLRHLAHNVGGELFFAHYYDPAIPLFEKVKALGLMSPHTYLWLASSLQRQKADPQRIHELLERVGVEVR